MGGHHGEMVARKLPNRQEIANCFIHAAFDKFLAWTFICGC